MAPAADPHGLTAIDAQLVQRGTLCWTLDAALTFMGSPVPVRMTVLGIPPPGKQKSPKKGTPPPLVDLVVVSPLEPTPAVVSLIKAVGHVKFIVAPNAMHHLFAGAFKAAFPGAQLIAPPSLKAKVPTLRADFIFPALPAAWPAEQVSLVSLPFVAEELVLVHKPSGTLVVTDLCFNFGEEHNKSFSWFMSTYLWATGGKAKCTLTSPFKWLIKDPAGLQAALDKLLTLSFDQLIMAHGNVVASGGKQALKDGTYAFVARLAEQRAQPSLLAGLSKQLPQVEPKYLAGGALAAAALGYAVLAAAQRARR